MAVKRLLKRAILSIAAMLVCLGSAEIATRMVGRIQQPIIQRHPVLGKTYLPHFDGDVFVEEAGRDVHLRFNRDGFRGEDVPLERPTGRRRVAVIGDSFVVAVATDEERTTVRQLEKLLNSTQRDGLWEVLNFGVSSSSTGQELVLYRELVSRYEPDLVVCAYSMRNDFADNSCQLTHAARIYFEIDLAGQLVQKPLSRGRTGLSLWLNRNSRFYVWQKTAFTKARLRMNNNAAAVEAGRWIFNTKPTERFDAVWELNHRLIEELNSEVKSRGADFVLALLPCAEQVDPEVWKGLLSGVGNLAPDFDWRYGENRLVAFCRASGIPVIPMASAFRQAHRERGQLYLRRDGHFNDTGNLVAAEVIHRYLVAGEGKAVLQMALGNSPCLPISR